MTRAYWSQVKAGVLAVPDDRPLADLTTELTTMLGSPDPSMRDDLAYPTLATWVDRGVYDDLITGLGDGMAAGLTVGLGEQGTDSVFRRAFSVLVLAECIDRDNQEGLLPAGKLLEWGDRIASWYLRERDLRGFVAGKGWAHTVAHGADAIGVLGRSPHLGRNELTVLRDFSTPAERTDRRRRRARVRRRERPVHRDGQRPGVPAGPLPPAGHRAVTARHSVRPAAGAGLGAAHDQPVVPVLTYSSVTCGHDR